MCVYIDIYIHMEHDDSVTRGSFITRSARLCSNDSLIKLAIGCIGE